MTEMPRREAVFTLCDDLGPERVVHVSTPGVKLSAILVIDNIAAGPAIGGVRLAPDATLEECARLARAMTLKNAAAGLPHGGGKSVILADPQAPWEEKERLVRAFARAIRREADYIPGPDMGLDERAMGWMLDEGVRTIGLPRALGGFDLDKAGATAWGLVAAAEAAEGFGGPKIDGARVVVQGFGAVGANVARFLAERGAVIIGAADADGAVANADGLDVAELLRRRAEGEGPLGVSGGREISAEELVALDCDIWIPAARPDVFTGANAGNVRARMILQGANIPATAEAERMMGEAGILVIPDFIANAGGVIGGAVEHRGGTAAEAFAAIREKIAANTAEVLTRARDGGVAPRAAAEAMALERVRAAMALRRFAARG